MKITIIALALTSTVTTSTFASSTDVQHIEQAAATLDIQELRLHSQSAQGYEQGLAYYRLSMSQYLQAQQQAAQQSLEMAQQSLEQLLAEPLSDTELGEAKALLAQVYGFKITFNPLKGAYYGPKAGKLLSQAERLAPNSPRVHLIKGVSAYNTPSMFGGSKQQALRDFNKAVLLFSQQQDTRYGWGEAETYTWRGLTQKELGHGEQALADWQQALQVNPDYGWAKMLIAKNQ